MISELVKLCMAIQVPCSSQYYLRIIMELFTIVELNKDTIHKHHTLLLIKNKAVNFINDVII